MAGNGGDEILALIARAAFEPGDEILIPHPAFEPYDIEARLSGATPVHSPLKGYDTDLGDMLARVTARTKVIFLCTPHNPATTIIRRGPLERFLEALGTDPPLVVRVKSQTQTFPGYTAPLMVCVQRSSSPVPSRTIVLKPLGICGESHLWR